MYLNSHGGHAEGHLHYVYLVPVSAFSFFFFPSIWCARYAAEANNRELWFAQQGFVFFNNLSN